MNDSRPLSFITHTHTHTRNGGGFHTLSTSKCSCTSFFPVFSLFLFFSLFHRSTRFSLLSILIAILHHSRTHLKIPSASRWSPCRPDSVCKRGQCNGNHDSNFLSALLVILQCSSFKHCREKKDKQGLIPVHREISGSKGKYHRFLWPPSRRRPR